MSNNEANNAAPNQENQTQNPNAAHDNIERSETVLEQTLNEFNPEVNGDNVIGNDIDITVTANVHDFEMDAITVNGIKLSLGITVDSKEFTGQISELTDAIKGLDDGAAEFPE